MTSVAQHFHATFKLNMRHASDYNALDITSNVGIACKRIIDNAHALCDAIEESHLQNKVLNIVQDACDIAYFG